MKNSRNKVDLRQKNILRSIQKKGSATVTELAEQYQTTPTTIRRDLENLEKSGYIRRYFGGAKCLLPPNTDVQYRTPKGNPTPSKIAIAKKAAEMISNHDTVMLNSSSTALLILDYLTDLNVNVITNNARALYSKPNPGIDIFLTGGEIYGNKQSLVGMFAIENLRRATANICFLGASGVSSEGGITSAILQEVSINQEMLRQCSGPRVIVADSSKIGVRQNFFSVGLDSITHLITDNHADPEELERIRKAGVEVIIAEID